MCRLCLDHRASVLVYVINAHPCALTRHIELDVCDDCEGAAVRNLEEHPYGQGMAQIVRWAA